MAESMAIASTAFTSTSTATSPTISTAPIPNASQPYIPKAAEADPFLKPASPRKRRRSPGNSPVSQLTNQGLNRPPPPTSPKSFLSSRPLPIALTAAAEMADQKRRKIEVEKEQSRQRSPNVQKSALETLLGGSYNGMSRPQDAPSAANTLSEAIAAVAPVIEIPEQSRGAEGSLQTSPVSVSSFGTIDSIGVTTVRANGPQVASPGHLGEDDALEIDEPRRSTPTRADTEELRDNKAFTYPGPLLGAPINDTRRGMSLPGSGFPREESKSPSSLTKKHKCPYCSTEFTRHHNLKSHLLTHSHEKPYMCQTCDSRFRRLHDLKRHTKLHTGERPHVCPKCKRSFARGDALARHNKGQGGCAGRRSSVGSYGGEGMPGDDSIDGLMYTGEASHEPESMDDAGEGADSRQQSLPSIRRHEAPQDPNYRQTHESQSTYQARQPSTYPPVAARQQTMGGLYPPNASHGGGSSTSTSPGTQPGTLHQFPSGSGGSPSYQGGGGANVFAQGGMTESPKPLSPAGISHQLASDSGIRRNRSPSLSQQFQQQQFGRRTHNRATPPPMGLPPPPSMGSASHANAPHLPSLPGLTPPEPRFTLPSQTGHPPHGPPMASSSRSNPNPAHSATGAASSSYHSQQAGLSSASDSHSSHSTGPHRSGDRGSQAFPTDVERMWSFFQSLDARVNVLEKRAGLEGQSGVGLHR